MVSDVKNFDTNKNILSTEVLSIHKTSSKKMSRTHRLQKIDESNQKLPVKVTQESKRLHVPKEVRSVIDYWNTLPQIRKHINSNTRIYRHVVETVKNVFRGTFFSAIDVFSETNYNRTFSKAELIQSIHNFWIAATSPDQMPHLRHRYD